MDIRNERKTKGLSQIKLAFRSGVSRYRLYLHENGYLKLRAAEQEKIEKTLKRKKQVPNE